MKKDIEKYQMMLDDSIMASNSKNIRYSPPVVSFKNKGWMTKADIIKYFELLWCEGFGEEAEEGLLVTAAELKAFGWSDTSKPFVDKLNAALVKYRITDETSIAYFMATMGHESAMGTLVIEDCSGDHLEDKDYTIDERGAGYIQITYRETHLAFLATVPDSFNGLDTARHIANNYPMEAAAWFWAKLQTVGEDPNKFPLNEYVTNHSKEEREGLFLASQYFVNGYVDNPNFNDDLASARAGGDYTIENGEFKVNNTSYRLPKGWDDRQTKYKSAMEVFLN